MIGIQGENGLEEVTKSPCDTSLDASSTNAVENRVVTQAINELNSDIDDSINSFATRYEPWTLNNASVSESDVINFFGNTLAPQLPNDHYGKPIAFNCSAGWYYGSCSYISPSGTLIGFAQNTNGQMFRFTKFSGQSATWDYI